MSRQSYIGFQIFMYVTVHVLVGDKHNAKKIIVKRFLLAQSSLKSSIPTKHSQPKWILKWRRFNSPMPNFIYFLFFIALGKSEKWLSL